MVLVISKKQILMSLLLCTALGFLWGAFRGLPLSKPVFFPEKGEAYTVILDPGHGGEDGGAVSPNGVRESPLNLEISLKIREFLRLFGQPVVMTREEDCSLDGGEATMRQRKTADLKQRVRMVNEREAPILLSIHQNSLPSSPVTHGAQVFWNRAEGAEALAEAVQEDLNLCINPGNEKRTKPIPDSVYLMKAISAPGVLVECGFLSNQEETKRLQDPHYQQKLAISITAGFLCGLSGEEKT